MDNAAMKRFAIKATVFGVISIAVMLQRSATKHIMITDASGVTIDRGTAKDAYKILVDRKASDSQKGKLTIPLSKSVSSDDIVLEDGYMDHELRIHIDSREEGFYLDNAVVTDLDIFESAICYKENDTGSVCLDFKLNDFYVNESSLTESSTIEIEFAKPSQKYDKIVLVNPDGGALEGSDETYAPDADAVLDVAMLLKNLAEKDDNNIRFFFTRTGETASSDDKMLNAIKASEADLVVEIGLIKDPAEEGVISRYNDTFFTRGLNNAGFADLLERNCAKKTGAKAIGIFSTTDDDKFLMGATVPGARIEVGCEGSKFLGSAGYKKKAAEGIYDAVLEAFEELE
ncbi:hypothetical protein D6853_01715 [Butyrivibrio sp. X503]|uniref:hypothetical protein n=1 Tax=Butyrivibrio sp. X503 TaxID=2364878 RepID=UPI000EA9AA0A|nr:hypothetical protein [Butyrivibrio sp. X503]RKM58275.1 hypothetical protein D6853_01715 [Butyrivibrio sp. X503]